MKCKYHGELTEDLIQILKYKNKVQKKCRICERERAKKYANKNKEKRAAYEKQRWLDKKEEITLKRKKPERLKKRRDSYQKNIDKYREEGKVKQEVMRDKLHNSYIKKLIKGDDKCIKFNKIPDSLVQLKKAIILSRRAVRKVIIKNRIEKNENK